MAFKRLIAMVPVKDGQVVMSYGYRRHTPAGSLGPVLRNLDRWGIDEISVIDISRGLGKPNFSLLEQIRLAGIRTPVAFGGGIRCVKDAVTAVALGCDRVIIETLLWQSAREVSRIADAIGQQAVIGAVPVIHGPGSLMAVPAHGAVGEPWSECVHRLQHLAISELIVIDKDNEGYPGRNAVAEQLPPSTAPYKYIWFGGLTSAQAALLLHRADTVGVAFGNPLLVTELAVDAHRRHINALARPQPLRKVQPHAKG